MKQNCKLMPSLFLSIGLDTVFRNLLIILANGSDPYIHMPMYFFLSNLSFCDTIFTSITIPKMLVKTQTQCKGYAGCLTQMYFFRVFVRLDDFFLAVMAYDCFLAICNPLHYVVIMKPWLCFLLVLGSWTMSVLYFLLKSLMVLQLSFHLPLEIPYFFFELNQIIHLACSDTFFNDIVIYFTVGLQYGSPLTGVLFSNSKIVSSICAISSTQRKYKIFSTCASHLSAVSFFYCTILGVYVTSTVLHIANSSAPASVMDSVFPPMLNTFIYTLRNKDLKVAMRIFLGNDAIKSSFILGLRSDGITGLKTSIRAEIAII